MNSFGATSAYAVAFIFASGMWRATCGMPRMCHTTAQRRRLSQHTTTNKRAHLYVFVCIPGANLLPLFCCCCRCCTLLTARIKFDVSLFAASARLRFLAVNAFIIIIIIAFLFVVVVVVAVFIACGCGIAASIHRKPVDGTNTHLT